YAAAPLAGARTRVPTLAIAIGAIVLALVLAGGASAILALGLMRRADAAEPVATAPAPTPSAVAPALQPSVATMPSCAHARRCCLYFVAEITGESLSTCDVYDEHPTGDLEVADDECLAAIDGYVQAIGRAEVPLGPCGDAS
ncbi:MAG: hypothetical protein M3Y87_27115, partial [Myxococcota bacterium]|nr:hypothetical protein [Myxococcota bacterium]